MWMTAPPVASTASDTPVRACRNEENNFPFNDGTHKQLKVHTGHTEDKLSC